jgi:hypothetical protein
MKKMLLLSLTFLLITGRCNANDEYPPHAASTQTWRFGHQVWSNAILIPECNKADFTRDNDTPDCRSYTSGSATMHYYNWAYVHAHKNTLCPAPWRVPTKNDLEVLTEQTTLNTLVKAWGYGGLAFGNSIIDADSSAYYWSSTTNGSNHAYTLDYLSGYLIVNFTFRSYGFQVRCVR